MLRSERIAIWSRTTTARGAKTFKQGISYLKSAAAASEGLQHQHLPSMAYTLPLEMLVDMHLTSWAAAGDHEAVATLVPDYKVTPTGQSYAAQQSLLRPPARPRHP